MSIFEKRQERSGIVSTLGTIINAPLNFAKDIIKLPFDTVGAITTKFVIVVALLMAGVYFLSKSDIAKRL